MELMKCAKIIQNEDGELYDVGGGVRDDLLGEISKDRDYCVTGFTREKFLSVFPEAKQVIGQNGEKTVDVFLMELDGEVCEVALARTEKKVAAGYHGFTFHSDEFVTIEEDLRRRDLTINSMARHVLTGKLIDPYGGEEDLKNGILRATSEAFKEDPLRVYRVAVRHAKMGFVVEEGTKQIMKSCKEELSSLKKERVVEELKKAFNTKRPDYFFRLLREVGLLSVHFKEIDDTYGIPQPANHHPEGHVFEHIVRVLLTMRMKTGDHKRLYAALTHDVGKFLTPKEILPAHHGHEQAGIPLVEALNKRLGVPTRWAQAAVFGCEHHGRFHRLGEMRCVKIVDLLNAASRSPLGVEGLAELCESDMRGKGDTTLIHPWKEFALEAIEEMNKVKGDTSLAPKKIAEDKRKRQAAVVEQLLKKMGK